MESTIKWLAKIFLTGIGSFYVVAGIHTAHMNRPLVHGLWLLDRSHYDEAIVQITVAINHDENTSSRYVIRAVAYHLKDDQELALRDIGKALSIQPGAADAAFVKAQILARMGRLDEAMKLLETWTNAKYPPELRGLAHGNRAYLLAQVGKNDQALEEYDVALAHMSTVGSQWWPYSPWRYVTSSFFLGKARLHRLTGDIESAKLAIEESIKRDDNDELAGAFLERILIERLLTKDDKAGSATLSKYTELSGASDADIDLAFADAKAGKLPQWSNRAYRHSDRRHYFAHTAIFTMDSIVVGVSAIFAFIFYLWWVRPGAEHTLLPFHKAFDARQVGFMTLAAAISGAPDIRVRCSIIYGIPSFASLYLLALVVISHLFTPFRSDIRHAVFFLVAFGLTLLPTIPKFLYVLLGIAFGIGILVGRSLFSGFVGVAFGLSIAFSASYVGVNLLEIAKLDCENRSGRSLNNEELSGPYRRWTSFKYYFSAWGSPLCMVILLVLMLVGSSWSSEGPRLRYVPDWILNNPVVLTPMLLIYLNYSFHSFGGISTYIQADFLDSLGQRIAFQRAAPQVFLQQETELSSQYESALQESQEVPYCINSTDRVLPLAGIEPKKFNVAIAFLTLDALLTFSTMFGHSFLPGITVEQTGTLSSCLKIPFYFVAITMVLFQVASKVGGAPELQQSPTVRAAHVLHAGVSIFVSDIQEFFRNQRKNYLNLDNNDFIIWASGAQALDKERKNL